MRLLRFLCVAAALLGTSARSDAQVKRPTPTITAEVAPAAISPGAPAHLRLKVVLPSGLHVQSDKPRDPALIPTALTITAPAGVRVVRTTYPKAADLAQPGGGAPLAVFSSTFVIDAEIALAPTVDSGTLKIPGELRYQSCTDEVCFPPSRAAVTWRLTVRSR